MILKIITISLIAMLPNASFAAFGNNALSASQIAAPCSLDGAVKAGQDGKIYACLGSAWTPPPTSTSIGGFNTQTGKIWDGAEACATTTAPTAARGINPSGVAESWPAFNIAYTVCARVSGNIVETRSSHPSTNLASGFVISAVDSGWRPGITGGMAAINSQQQWGGWYYNVSTIIVFNNANPTSFTINGSQYTIPF